MIQEKFAYGQSFIHKLDPKIRILASIVLSFATALCNTLSLIVMYVVISGILTAMARLRPSDVLSRIKPLFWFLLMIWIILPLTFEGEILFQYHWVKVSLPGVLLCGKITLKSIAIGVLFTALIATMTIASLGNGLHRLHVPDKMVFLLLMSYRYIFVIEEEYKRLLRAAKFRGFKPKTNVHSYKTAAYLAGMLFVRASLRAQRVYQAMLCRGFNQKFHSLDDYPPNRLNSFFLTGIVVACASLVLAEIIWV